MFRKRCNTNRLIFWYKVVSVDGTSDGRTADVILRTITDATMYGGNRHKWRLESRIRMTNDGSGWIIRESRVSTF